MDEEGADDDCKRLAMLTSQIARQLAIIGDEVNDRYTSEFRQIMSDVSAKYDGFQGNALRHFCYGLLRDLALKMLTDLLTPTKQVRCLRPCQQNKSFVKSVLEFVCYVFCCTEMTF